MSLPNLAAIAQGLRNAFAGFVNGDTQQNPAMLNRGIRQGMNFTVTFIGPSGGPLAGLGITAQLNQQSPSTGLGTPIATLIVTTDANGQATYSFSAMTFDVSQTYDVVFFIPGYPTQTFQIWPTILTQGLLLDASPTWTNLNLTVATPPGPGGGGKSGMALSMLKSAPTHGTETFNFQLTGGPISHAVYLWQNSGSGWTNIATGITDASGGLQGQFGLSTTPSGTFQFIMTVGAPFPSTNPPWRPGPTSNVVTETVP